MMTYIRESKVNKGKGTRVVAIGVFAFVVIVIGIRFLAPDAFAGLFTAIARPFWRIEYSISSGQLQSAEALLGANQDLSRKLNEADMKLQSVSAIIAENEQLKSMMGRASSTDCVLAAVLRKPPMSPYDELVIDAGMDYGFTEGDIVYAGQNVPIGKITSVLTHSANVLLFSSPGQKYEVSIGKSTIPATAIGKGGGQYSAELPRTANVAVGDFVERPGMKSNLFAVVETVISDPSEPFQTVLFAAPINIYELKWVYVERGR